MSTARAQKMLLASFLMAYDFTVKNAGKKSELEKETRELREKWQKWIDT